MPNNSFTKFSRLLLYAMAFLFIGQSLQAQCTPPIIIDNGYPVITNPRCGENNGEIEVQASGTPNIRYRINSGPWLASGLFQNLISGSYIIDIRDGNLCMQSISIPLSGESAPVINSVNISHPSCTTNDGSAVISATGNMLEYSLDNINYQSSNTFSNLGAGTITVWVRDANMCIASRNETLTDNGIVINSATATPTSCAASSGTISVNASGNGQVEYSIDNVAWQNNGNYTGLAPGLYTIRMRDQTGCTRSINRRVGNTLQFATILVHSDCGQDNGSITVNVSTAGTYSYRLGNGTYQGSNVFANLSPGNYAVRIRDDVNGCVIVITRRINELTTISNIVPASTPSTCIANTGTITVAAMGNGLQYSIDGGTTFFPTGVFTSLGSGNYNVIIEDVNGCQESVPVTVLDTGIINISAITPTSSDCNLTNGQLDITATGVGPLEYSLDDGTTWFPTNVFTGLAPGTYTATVRDSDGCTRMEDVGVGENNDISFSSIAIQAPSTACSGDGSIDVVYTGTGIEYSIDNINFTSTGNFSNLNPGQYIIYVRNSLGCSRETGAIDMPGAISLDMVTPTPTVCSASTGTIEILGTGDMLEYSIDDVDYFSSNIFTDLAPGNYTAWIRDINNCKLSQNVTIANTGGVTINLLTPTPTRCGDPVGEIVVQATTTATTLEYSIDGVNFQPSPLLNNVAGGTQTVTVRDDVGCMATAETFVPESFPIVLANIITKESICDFNDGLIDVIASGGTGTLRYSLDDVNYQPESRFLNMAPGMYTVYISDDVNCLVFAAVEIEQVCEVKMPSAITPNGNGENDIFRILYSQPLNVIHCRIFNRWGEMVHESENFSSDQTNLWWTGRDASGEINTGVYYYEIRYVDENDARRRLSGSVTVIP